MDTIKALIGNRMKEERKRLGMTQTELATIAESGTRTVQDWEGGKFSPPAHQLAAMSKSGIDITYLITGLRPDLPELASSLDLNILQTCIEAAFSLQGHSSPRVIALNVVETYRTLMQQRLERPETPSDVRFRLEAEMSQHRDGGFVFYVPSLKQKEE